MKSYNDPTYPPKGLWDPRLSCAECKTLQPVEEIHSNPWFVLNSRGGYYTIELRHPSVVILPIVDSHSILMVRPIRPVVVDCPLELPAGGVDEGELPVEGAARELQEETGIRVEAARLVPMTPISLSPNRFPQLIYIFQVDLTQNEFEQRKLHDEEIDALELVTFQKAMDYLVSGGIYVAVPAAVIGIYLLKQSLQKQP